MTAGDRFGASLPSRAVSASWKSPVEMPRRYSPACSPAERVDDRAGAEEEAGLEERVREDVEHAADECADAAGEEHVAELRDRRVREDLLDVVLRQADRRREERREAADDRDDDHRVGREPEEHVAARDHVDARRDHRRRVDQRRDGRRARHRVGQPDVERELRGLAARADEEAEADERQEGA